MKVKELIEALRRFDPEGEVRLGVQWPDRVTETYDRIVVGDHGGGPILNALMDFKGLRVYVGCELQATARKQPAERIDLGQYESVELAAKVRDFYVVHRGLNEPLNYPDFDYEKWLPPRTTSGDYSRHIAEILREKLLRE